LTQPTAANEDRVERAKIAKLEDRGVVSVAGPDAAKFLQSVITNDIEVLSSEAARHAGRGLFAGLLSPQGKLLFDFIISKQPEAQDQQAASDAFYLDVARDQAAALTKRLTLYKLRAKVEIKDECDVLNVLAMWGVDPCFICLLGFADPRHPGLGLRGVGTKRFVVDDMSCSNGVRSTEHDYHAHRIALGIPEGGKDYPFADAFAHEALFDQLKGVSFTKGCYVGQEIVARMEHRGTARNRVVKVSAESDLPAAGTPVIANEVAIGTLGSSHGNTGLAMVRLDRLAEFNDRGIAISAAGQPITLTLQDFVTYTLSDFTRTARL
jgi:tRNA-modifying protein YgfZ